ncbi:MAG TPA: porin family protein [Chitinophagaceae bacterium]|nr:porin family protein [Chitinophagaceae bacterium]
MKKIISSLLCLLFIFHGQTQKSHLYLKGGLNISAFTSDNPDNFYEVNPLTSFNVGALARINVSKQVTIQPAIQISGKGAKTKGGEPPYTHTYFESTTQPYYLELPINVVFDVPAKGAISLFFGAGMYGSLGIGGKNKISGTTASTGSFSDERKIDFKSQNSYPNFHNWAGIGYMNKEDFGITATAGLKIKKFLVFLDYEHGLKNIDIGTRVEKDDNTNRVFGLSIAWQIL